jgi:RNA polymerase sigma-70 factor (ECF subfamily)
MPDSRAEAELLKQACRGDGSAFQIIYERHRNCVFRFAYRMLGTVAAAEDITHDCFLSLLQKPQLFDPDRASLRTYMCAAARNLAWKQLHRRGMENDAGEMPEEPADGRQNGPYEHRLSSEIAERVQKAVLSLPPLQREAIILFEFEELSLSDIAAVAQTDVGSIKSRLHRARQRLRELLAPWIPSGELLMMKEAKP